MELRSILILFLLLLLPVFPQQYPDKQVHNLLSSGINSLLNSDYISASKDFSTLKKKFPYLPLGDIYLAAVEITKSYDLQSDFNDSMISLHLDSAFLKSEHLMESGPENEWNYFFAGVSRGYKAYYHALNENWVTAFTNGLDAVDFFESASEDSHDFYEAAVPVAVYNYWKSRKLKDFAWLPFINDNSDAWLESIESFYDSLIYQKSIVLLSLVWIYIDRGEYKKAAEISEQVIRDHPGNRIFRWALARAYENIDKSKAIEIYRDLIRMYPENAEVNGVILRHKIAIQLLKLRNNEEALKLCTEILSKKYSQDAENKLKMRLARIEHLYNSIPH